MKSVNAATFHNVSGPAPTEFSVTQLAETTCPVSVSSAPWDRDCSSTGSWVHPSQVQHVLNWMSTGFSSKLIRHCVVCIGSGGEPPELPHPGAVRMQHAIRQQHG